MIEVFKTTVQSSNDAAMLLALLRGQNPSLEVNFDLEDCDNILRVEGLSFCSFSVIYLLTNHGFECMILK